jgi:hypothetical protein
VRVDLDQRIHLHLAHPVSRADVVEVDAMAVLRRIRVQPTAKPLEDMTVSELHELASEPKIAGRSSMSKAS